MLTKELDRETELLLAEILEQENTTSDELIKHLIRDRWLSLHRRSPELPLDLSVLIEQESQPEQEAGRAEQPQLRQKNHKQTIAEFLRRKRSR